MAPDPRQPLPRLQEYKWGELPPPPVGDLKLDPAELGDGAALIAEYLSKKFPNMWSVLPAVGPLWSVIEVLGFLKSRGRENRGDMVALVAEFVAMYGRGQIKKGVALTGARLGAYVLAEGFIIAWTTYEAFKLGMYLGVASEEAERRREKMYQTWSGQLRVNFWMELDRSLGDTYSHAFDQIAGAKASHGVAPIPTREAIRGWIALTEEISRGWLDRVQRLQELEVQIKVASLPGRLHYQEIERRVRDARAEMGEIEVAMARDVTRVIDYRTDPGNWQLTSEQQALLPSRWQELFAARDSLMSATVPHPDPHHPGLFLMTYDEVHTALEQVKSEMAAEVQKDAAGGGPPNAAEGPMHGPEPRRQ